MPLLSSDKESVTVDESPIPTGESISSEFQKILDLNDELNQSKCSITDSGYQKKVREAIVKLEMLTKNVNQLSLFSRNETVEEISTENLKYLLLPALLADFTLRNQQYDRIELLEMAEIYFKDYIERLNEYGICDVTLKKKDNSEDEDNANEDSKTTTTQVPSKIPYDPLIKSAQLRESKINRYKQSKQLEEQLGNLKKLIFEQENNGLVVDEEIERKFYLTLIDRWLNRALEELTSIEMELPMAKMRRSMIQMDIRNSGGSGAGGSDVVRGYGGSGRTGRDKSKPLRPIIITRDQVEKQIYGLGYPSVPTVTVDEFINQKIQEGSLALTDERIYGNSLYDWANDPDKKKEQDITEEEQKEILNEKDDEFELTRARQMDDWKDEHKRGEGNRHNMG